MSRCLIPASYDSEYYSVQCRSFNILFSTKINQISIEMGLDKFSYFLGKTNISSGISTVTDREFDI